MKRHPILRLTALVLLVVRYSTVGGALDPEIIAAAEERWEQDIAALEALDKTQTHPADSVLFLGSSSIRRWDDMDRDMMPYHPIRRAFGGCKFSDVAVFAERLIRPHRFQALVLFVGNDVRGKPEDASPEQVVAWFRHIVSVAQAMRPRAEIFCLEITPTSSRWAVWPKIREVNRALARECEAHSGVHFIPTAHAYLGADGKPCADLFLEDELHLNPLGYRVWSAVIKSHLDLRLGLVSAGGGH